MVYEDLDAGDESGRNGDYPSFPHSNADGSALADATPDEGVPVTLDSNGEIREVDGGSTDGEADGSETVVGILMDYDVYGDTGQEQISDNDATVKFRGEVKADLGNYVAGAGVTVGEYVDDNKDLFVSEQVSGDEYVVQVR